MKYYKEIALKALFHNGKPVEKGEVTRERVPLSQASLRTLEETPEITNCKYVLIEEEVKAPKAAKTEKPEATEKKWAQMNAEERKEFKAKKAE